VNCIFIERTEGDSENKFSNMSGSLIRRYAILGNMLELYDVYNGLLSEEQVNELVRLIKFGVNYQDSFQGKKRSLSSSSPESTSPKSPKTKKRRSSSSSSLPKKSKKGGTKKKRVKRKSKRVKY